jgi:hypothetical protein
MTVKQTARALRAKEGEKMRVGAIARIQRCNARPEIVGERAEIVDMQIQEFDKYAVCPVWARVMSGRHSGRVYGFDYNELEVIPDTDKGAMKARVLEELEGILDNLDKQARASKNTFQLGAAVEIKKCESIPEVVGEQAEILDMQIQEFDKYAVYPVWVKMTSGKHAGEIYGFHYEELELSPRAQPAAATQAELIEKLEGTVKRMKIGGRVRVKKCDSTPDVVGQCAEIVNMQLQDLDRYATFPIWAKITSGEKKGKVYGFYYDEIEVMPEIFTSEKIKTEVDEQLDEIFRGVETMADIVALEKIIAEVKGKIQLGAQFGFWEGKTPCWEILRCPENIRTECPAFRFQSMPCWQIEGTYCKLSADCQRGDNTDICRVCRVYKRWSQGEPVEIKLHGMGLNKGLAVAPK